MRWLAVLLLLLLLVSPPAAAAGDPIAAVDGAIARWEAACRATPAADGSCVRVRTAAARHRCTTTTRTVEVRRSARTGRAARAALVAGLAALDGRTDPPAREAAARAEITLGEMAYEELLRLRFPSGLDFTGRGAERSRKRFAAFVDDSGKKLDAASERYRAVIRNPAATDELRLRALARTGQMHARMSELVAGAEIPRELRTGPSAAEQKEAFCAALAAEREPMEARAREAFEACRPLAAGHPPWDEICGP